MTGERIQSQIAGAAFLENRQDDRDAVKLTDDRYEIYVNDDFVGYKTLLNRNDDLQDVDDFLHQQGVQNFKTLQDGDHYKIETLDAKRARDVLSVYCQNR